MELLALLSSLFPTITNILKKTCQRQKQILLYLFFPAAWTKCLQKLAGMLILDLPFNFVKSVTTYWFQPNTFFSQRYYAASQNFSFFILYKSIQNGTIMRAILYRKRFYQFYTSLMCFMHWSVQAKWLSKISLWDKISIKKTCVAFHWLITNLNSLWSNVYKPILYTKIRNSSSIDKKSTKAEI